MGELGLLGITASPEYGGSGTWSHCSDDCHGGN